MSLIPKSIEKYVSESNPVKVCDVFVDSLDFKNWELPFMKIK